MSVVARFFVQSTQRFAHNREQLTVSLSAAGRGPENKVWASATPSGTLSMTVSNAAAAA